MSSQHLPITELKNYFINEIGHDGLEVWWPQAVGVFKHRGFHVQELVDCCLRRHFAPICIDAYPGLGRPGGEDGRAIFMTDEAKVRLQTVMNKFDGVLITASHAAAWSHGEQICYDPNGYTCSVGDYQIREFWALVEW